MSEKEEFRSFDGKVFDYVTKRWRGGIFPTEVRWNEVEKRAEDESYLQEIGGVGVDRASVEVAILIGDLVPDVMVRMRNVVFTPEGDGEFRVLAGKIKGIGKCLVVAFDAEEGAED
jgi:hypothetical protein